MAICGGDQRVLDGECAADLRFVCIADDPDNIILTWCEVFGDVCGQAIAGSKDLTFGGRAGGTVVLAGGGLVRENTVLTADGRVRF